MSVYQYPEILLDFDPAGAQSLEDWLAHWRTRGLVPTQGTPGVFTLGGRVVHRYRMQPKDPDPATLELRRRSRS